MNKIIGLSNGYANNGKSKGTMGLTPLIQELVGESQGIRVAHIVDAAEGLTGKRWHHIELAEERMRRDGFYVQRVNNMDNGWKTVAHQLANKNVIYINGGRPPRIADALIRSGIVEHLQELRESKLIVGASAGIMALAGSLWPVRLMVEDAMYYHCNKDRCRWQGAGVIPAIILPHEKPNSLVTKLVRALSLQPVIAIPDGEYQIFE